MGRFFVNNVEEIIEKSKVKYENWIKDCIKILHPEINVNNVVKLKEIVISNNYSLMNVKDSNEHTISLTYLAIASDYIEEVELQYIAKYRTYFDKPIESSKNFSIKIESSLPVIENNKLIKFKINFNE